MNRAFITSVNHIQHDTWTKLLELLKKSLFAFRNNLFFTHHLFLSFARPCYDVKQEKKKKQTSSQKTASDSNVTYSNCKENGHKSAHSPSCWNHILSKVEVFSTNLEEGYVTFTRKMAFDKWVKNTLWDWNK